MPFDGIDPGSVDFAYPESYHPRAPCSPFAPARALKTAYAYARHWGQLCWECHVPMNHRRPDIQRQLDHFSATSFTPVGSGYHWLPEEATHLIGFALLNLDQAFVVQSVHCQLQLTDLSGVANDIGPDTTTLYAATDTGDAETRYSGTIGPFAGGQRGNVALQCEVPILAVSPGAIVFSKVMVWSNAGLLPGITAGATVTPHYAGVFWECRG